MNKTKFGRACIVIMVGVGIVFVPYWVGKTFDLDLKFAQPYEAWCSGLLLMMGALVITPFVVLIIKYIKKG